MSPKDGITYYPVFLNLRRKKCVVLGGGRVAERKIHYLLSTGAQVSCVSESFSPKIRKLARRGDIHATSRKLDNPSSLRSCLSRAFMAIAATSSPRVNAMIFSECAKKNILVNSVDDPDHSNFITPSIIRRGDLAIAISTGGKSPALARALRKSFEKELGPEYGGFLEFMARERKKIVRSLRNAKQRKKILRELAGSRLLNLFRKKNRKIIDFVYESILNRHGVSREDLR